MATISSLGVGANLDLASLLTQLQTAESQPLVALQAKAKSYTSKLSAYGTIQSALSTLQTAAKKLGDPTLFQSVTGTPTVSGILAASATDASAAGNYTIDVQQLAQAQTVISAGQVDTKTAIGNGKITIDFGQIAGGTLNATTGQYTGATFTADASQPAKSITIDPTNNTLEGIRNAINGASAGVTATIVNDGSGAPNRLVLTSSTTGEKSSMRISVDGDATLQNLLGNDPAGTQNLKQTSAAQNAKLNVNGIDVTSATNTVKEAIQGATLTLVNTGKTGLSMKENTAGVKTAITDFVNAYNALQSTAKSLTTYDADTNTVGRAGGRQHAAQPADAHPPGAHDAAGRRRQRHEGAHRDRRGLPEGRHDRHRFHQARQGPVHQPEGRGQPVLQRHRQHRRLRQADRRAGDRPEHRRPEGRQRRRDLHHQAARQQYDAMQARVDSTVARYKAQFTQLDVLINSMNNTKTYLTQQFEAMSSSK
jgi:flagellar hook-associated protein 2